MAMTKPYTRPTRSKTFYCLVLGVLIVNVFVGMFLTYSYFKPNRTSAIYHAAYTSRRMIDESFSSVTEMPLGNSNHLTIVPSVDDCNFGFQYRVGGKTCCVCPKHSLGDQCETLKPVPKFFKKITSCFGDWKRIDWNLEVRLDKTTRLGEMTLRMADYIGRYIRWQGQGGRDTCTPKFDNAVDTFFHGLGVQYGPFTDNDAIALHTLHRFNQYMFVPGASPAGKPPISFETPTVPGKVLFVLMFHDREDLSENLLYTIMSKKHYYIISISKQASKMFWRRMHRLVQRINMPNVIILPEEFSIEGAWSDVSLLYMELVPAAYAMMQGWVDWSYKIALSSTHFPARNLHELSEYLASNPPETVYSEHQPRPLDRIQTVQIFLDGLCRNVFGMHTDLSKYNHTLILPPQGGSQWHVVPRNVLLYIFTGRLSLEYMLTTKQSAVPDEMYIPTMLHALQFSPTWQLSNDKTVTFTKQPVIRERSETLCFLEFWGPRPRPIDSTQFLKVHMSHKFFARKIVKLSDAKEMAEFFDIVPEMPELRPRVSNKR